MENIVDIRGQGPEKAAGRVKILVDGVPMNILDLSHALVPINTIAVEDIEKIEIINGGGSVLYGNGTAGGVVNIITKKDGKEGASGKAYFQNSSYKTNKLGFSTGLNMNNKLILDLGYENINGRGYMENDKKSSEFLKGGLIYNITDNQSLKFKATRYNEDSLADLLKTWLKEKYAKPGNVFVVTKSFILSQDPWCCLINVFVST